MRNKRVRILREKAIEIMPKSVLNASVGYQPFASSVLNPYKNFIRNERKASSPTIPASKKEYGKMMKAFNRDQRKLRKRRKAA